MIKSFRGAWAEAIFHREICLDLPQEIQRAALRRLLNIDLAESLQDLGAPPGNRLEKLRGDRAGAYSIRINDRWRVCFVWQDGHALDVEIVDYH